MLEIIRKILVEELGIENEIKLESKLVEDLKFDSLLAVQLSVLIEEKYEIYINEEELLKLITIKDIIELLEEKGINK